MSYSVTILRRARDELAGLPQDAYEEVRDRIRLLAHDPIPPESSRLAERGGWRLHAGKCRVVYEVDSRQELVTVLHIGRRADAQA